MSLSHFPSLSFDGSKMAVTASVLILLFMAALFAPAAQAQLSIRVYEPKNTVIDVLDGTKIYIDAYCRDDSNEEGLRCADLTLSIDGQEISCVDPEDLVEPGFLRCPLSLEPYRNGRDALELVFTGKQAYYVGNNVSTSTLRLTFNHHLDPVFTVPGRILDLALDRILYLRDQAVWLRRITAGQDVQVLPVEGGYSKAFLVPQGVVVSKGGTTHYWREDQPDQTQELLQGKTLVETAGNFALFSSGASGTTPPYDYALHLYDLTTGSTATYPGDPDLAVLDPDLAENGDVVFVTRGQISSLRRVHLWRSGNPTPITPVGQFSKPVTDGIHIVYLDEQARTVRLHSPSGEEVLTNYAGDPNFIPQFSYQVNNGWVAYQKVGLPGNPIFVRSPDGQEKRISHFMGQAPAVHLYRLSSNGDVVFEHIRRFYLGGYHHHGVADLIPLVTDSDPQSGLWHYHVAGIWFFAKGNLQSTTLHQYFGNKPNAPTASDLSLRATVDTPLRIHLPVSDPDSEILYYSLKYPSVHGTLTRNGTDWTYTPALDYTGPDAFNYQVSDGTYRSNIAVVQINVTPPDGPPVAQDVSVSTFLDTPVGVTLAGSDPAGDPLTYALLSQPAQGALSGTAPHLTYTPNAGFAGTDSFSYRVSDGTAESNTAIVTIQVVAPLLTLGSVTAGPGEETYLPVTLTGAASDVTGIELTLQAAGPTGAPLPDAVFFPTPATQGWTLAQNPANPWKVSLANANPLSGPTEVLRLRLTPSPQVPVGSFYRIEVASAKLTNAQGAETDVTSLISPGSLLVQPCEVRAKGDVNGDGAIDIRDAIFVLRTTVELDIPSNECAFMAADVNCTGSISVADAVLILRKIVFDEAFPCP